jgi:putative transposase
MSPAMIRRIQIEPGTWVMIQGRRACIVQVLDLETVVVQDSEREETWAAKICDLQPDEPTPEPPTETAFSELAEIEEQDWQTARERFEIIRPLLNDPDCTREKVASRAQAAGRHTTTLYRWLQDYRQSGQLSTLAPAKPGVPHGYSRLDPEVETILVATIEEFYLHGQKRSMQQTCHEVARRCRNAGIKRPHPNTVRHRIKALSDQETFRRREGGKGVRDKYTPIPGAFPGAHWPLAVTQIDHTPVDLILVDDMHRRPVGRPWVTVAIDVFSRLVAGFSVSFDPPGSLAVGLCLAHAILPKDLWLARHEIATAWPIWGVMDTVHADNAKEFRGSMLRKACQEYGIDLHWRPVRRPHFGGHIERLLGTFNQDIHALPGSTFSNPMARGAYDSEQHAAMTLAEFEQWLSILIVEVYHQRLHSELGMTPLQKYEEGIFGTDERPGRGLPERVMDEMRLRLNFMPYVERTVQSHGIVIDEIQYYDDVLKSWIHSLDRRETSGKRKQKFIVRRDPRDISRIYFYDPDLKQYFEIPYRNTTHPPMSVWELREVRRKLKEEGHKSVNEELIFDAYNRLRELEAEAVRETKKARRAAQRRRDHVQAQRPQAASSTSLSEPLLARAEDIEPFDEIEELDG